MKATELLKEDHDRVRNLFSQIQQATTFDEKKQTFRLIQSELDVHFHIEEVVIYPTLSLKDEFRDRTETLYDEHQEAKDLIAEIDADLSNESGFEERMDELIEDVLSHVDDEENDIFPRMAKSMDSAELEQLGARLEEVKRNYLEPTVAA